MLVRQSPWVLGPSQAALTAEWFRGWLDAALQQRPELTGQVAGYAERRLTHATLGQLGVAVQHVDLLAWPG